MDKYGLNQLVRDVAAGDAAAYRRLLEVSAKLVRGYLMTKLSGPLRADVEDIVQETLLAVHLKYNSYDVSLPYLPWLRTIAHHKLVDALRRRRASVPLDDEVMEHVAAEALETDAALSVGTLLAQLPEKQQNIVRLARIDGKSMTEVADETGMSVPAVKVALHRAIKRLGELARAGKPAEENLGGVHAHG